MRLQNRKTGLSTSSSNVGESDISNIACHKYKTQQDSDQAIVPLLSYSALNQEESYKEGISIPDRLLDHGKCKHKLSKQNIWYVVTLLHNPELIFLTHHISKATFEGTNGIIPNGVTHNVFND